MIPGVEGGVPDFYNYVKIQVKKKEIVWNCFIV